MVRTCHIWGRCLRGSWCIISINQLVHLHDAWRWTHWNLWPSYWGSPGPQPRKPPIGETILKQRRDFSLRAKRKARGVCNTEIFVGQKETKIKRPNLIVSHTCGTQASSNRHISRRQTHQPIFAYDQNHVTHYHILKMSQKPWRTELV